MKRILLLILVLFPFLGMGQTTFASWSVNNTLASTSQTYVTAPNLSIGDDNNFSSSYTSDGLALGRWSNSNYDNDRYFQIQITANTGTVLNFSELNLQYKNNSNGPTNARIKYVILDSGVSNPNDSDFLGSSATDFPGLSDVLLNRSNTAQTAQISLNGLFLTSGQRILIRVYGRGADDSSRNFTILKNTLNIKGCVPPGDPSVFGDNKWNVYGFNSGGITNPSDYRGYYVQDLGTDVGLDTQLMWEVLDSPSAASDWQGCSVNVDLFTMVHKRKGFPCGNYTLAFLYHDDATRIIIKDASGTTTTLNYPGFSGAGSISGTYALDANSTVEVRTFDEGTDSNVGITFTPNSYTPPVAPTTITGITSICSGSSTTLTTTAGLGTYQWGTGNTVGVNPIGGTSNSISVSPTSTTVYWVRVKGTFPCPDSSGITTTVTVAPQAVIPTSLTTPNATICSGTQITLTANGTSGTYQWGTGTVGNNIIADQSAATLVVSPTANTTYWVRVLATSPCTTNSGGRTLAITVSGTAPVNPTSIGGTTTICTGTGTTLTAVGSSGTYQWGTGTNIGSNIISGATSSTYNTGNLTTTTNYWVRVLGTSPCANSAGIKTTVTVIPQATAPTSLTSTSNSICSGTQITLTANGTSGTYQWGTGTVGSNIIADQSAATLVVSPTATTTYWVRVLAVSPCTTNTSGVTRAITVAASATAPTEILGTDSYCPGAAVILTASGGSGATYQWGTGSTIGSSIINGETASTITVNPNTATTYWVRRQNNLSPCTGVTSGVTRLVTVGVPGAPAGFGDNEWNVFGYTGGGNSAPTGYSGFYAQNLGSNVGVDTKLKWDMSTSPSFASGWNGCSISSNTTYTFIHKRKGFPCGNYLLTYTYYDDETTIIIKDANGTTSTINSTGYFNGGPGLTQAVNGTTTYALDSESTIEIRTTNSGIGESKLGIIFTPNAYTPPVAPTSITGVNSICSGTSTTLTANGTSGTYEWGTGLVVGTNPIAGTTNTITVSPTTNTTYWVRVKGTFPCPNSNGVTYAVTVTAPPVAPSGITGTTSICSGTSTTLTATAGLGTYEWGTGSTVGTNPIAGQTTNTLATGNLSTTTTYWVRVKGTSPCGDSSGITKTVTVTPAAVAPSAITGTTSICSGTSTTLTATAGLGTYEWGTGATVGTNPIAGSTNSITVSPASTTTYWVRVKGTSPCGDSSGITKTVTVTPAGVAPSAITGTTSICSGTSTTLIATAGLGTYEWGTGATVGTNPIAGSTNSITVSPASTTTYWVRVKGTSPCGDSSGITKTVTVTPAAVAPTAITGTTSICSGTSTTLTATAGLGTYEWGTGSTVGTNPIAGQTTNTLATGNLSTTTTYWVRVKGTSPCGDSSGISTTVTVTPAAVAPTAITGTTSICSGTSTTLTATAGLGTYEWGTGATVGTNPIAGQTTNTLATGNLSTTTTYWVRVKGTSPCGDSSGITTTVTITAQPVRPSSITATSTTICSGTQITLTANGTSGTYQWGTGATVGNNIITGESLSTLVVSPNATTTYWVRVLANSPCVTNSLGRILAITVNTTPVAPSGITGTTSICSGTSTTLTATAGLGTYEWGTGTVGTNSIAGQTTNILATGNLSSTTVYWVRVKGTSPCGDSSGISTTVTVTPAAVAPSGIAGITSICSGTSTTLTATAGLGTYEWGTGATVGTNPIAGSTNSITVSPASTTTYWVRVKGTSPCGDSSGISTTVTVTNAATAPTGISGIETSYCPSGPVTLTATGGTGDTYQWGTGSVVGTSPIAGQTSASITVNPSATTTYWVRRQSASPCSNVTSGVSKTITVLPIPGATAEFGTNEWNVYGYNSGGNSNPSDYRGYYVQNLGSNVGIDTKLKWNPSTSPSAASDWQGCAVNNDGFTMIHKRKGFPCGRYNIAFLYYDEDTVVIIKDANGTTSTLNFSGLYNGGAGLSQALNGGITYALDANSTIEIRTTDVTPSSEAKLGVTFTAAGPATYSNGAWEAGANPSYVDITLNDNFILPADLTVCTCTINDNFTATVPENLTLTVIGNATAVGTGKYIIESTGAFVQVNDNSTYTGISTSFTSKRKTQPVFRYDFTYWSSPVQDFILKSVSPLTIFDKFFSWNNITQAWQVHKTNLAPHTMIIGNGYSVRAPQSFAIEGAPGAVSQIYEAKFIGKPNTGTQSITVSNAADNKWNLIGNPYPSAINVTEFLKLNKDVIDGTLYFWTHKSPVIQNSPNPDYAIYSSTDYVAVNLSGNVSNESNSGIVSGAPVGSPYGLGTGSPFDNIASGQSFFVKGKQTEVVGSQVTFKNAMRVRVGGKNNQFFKPGLTTPVKDWEITGKHRIWLNIKTAQNDFNQALVGYIQEATNGLDWGYDGEVFSGGNVSIYSLLNTKGLTIQARALPFSAEDQVPLGYTTNQTGTINISIDHFDGLFSGQAIYLEDKVLNVVHNLKNASYNFTSAAGTFNSRFVLRYLPQDNLSTEVPTVDANSMVIFNVNNQISIKAKDLIIDQVFIYDLAGRLLFTKNNVNAEEFMTNSLTASNQVILVKVITNTKAEVVKKVIMK